MFKHIHTHYSCTPNTAVTCNAIILHYSKRSSTCSVTLINTLSHKGPVTQSNECIQPTVNSECQKSSPVQSILHELLLLYTHIIALLETDE